MEQFARLIVGGGVALVASLWLVAYADAWSIVWLLGVTFALLGTGSVLAGIVNEIDV